VEEIFQKSKYDVLMQRYCSTRDVELRNQLLDHYIYIAEIAAKKFSNRGTEYDDLFQVASLALIKALDRFDCSRDIKFSTFATPCVIGEIKNYFRDKSRVVRIPRRNSELLKKITTTAEELTIRLGTQPKLEQIAAELGIDTETVHELLEMRNQVQVVSLDSAINGTDGEITFFDSYGVEDTSYTEIENRDFFARVLNDLNEDERELIIARYKNGESQRQLADRMGVSQMYISRLERKILEKLRHHVK